MTNSELTFTDLKTGYTAWQDSQSIPADLAVYDNQPTSIRGFLYQLEGQWILASEPNLKSCCVGSSHKIDSQIALIESTGIEASSSAVTVQGNFKIEPGNEEYFYFLHKASIVQNADVNLVWPVWSLVGMCVVGLLLFSYMKCKKKQF